MRTVNVQLFTFSELSPEAQAKVLAKEVQFEQEYWEHQWCLEGIQDNILPYFGITESEVFFRLSYSQGDYAQVLGLLTVPEASITEKVQKDFPSETGIHGSAMVMEDLINKFAGFKLSFKPYRNSYHTYDWEVLNKEPDEYASDELEKLLKEFLKDLNSTLYRLIRNCYEADTSEEYIKTKLTENEDNEYLSNGDVANNLA